MAFYYERSRRFFIELPEETDEWQAPFLFSALVRRGQRSVGSVLTGHWVQSRIVPTDRQNLGIILKENGLKDYDSHKLLVLADGRCAQDDCCIVRTNADDLPDDIKARLQKKVLEAAPLKGHRALVLFKNDEARVIDVEEILKNKIHFTPVLTDNELFCSMSVVPGGNGVEWGEERVIPAEMLYNSGEKIDMAASDILQFSIRRLVTASEAANLLNCSRQYICQMAEDGRLKSITSAGSHKRYLINEVKEALE